MAKKYAKGGPTDEGSANEVLFPKGMQKTAQEMLEQAKKEKREAKEIKAPSKVSGMKKGGSVGSASKRADGCATKGKTKGRFV